MQHIDPRSSTGANPPNPALDNGQAEWAYHGLRQLLKSCIRPEFLHAMNVLIHVCSTDRHFGQACSHDTSHRACFSASVFARAVVYIIRNPRALHCLHGQPLNIE